MPLWFWYNPQGPEFQFQERLPWIPSIGAEYFLGIDGLSTLLILLTTMMGFIAILSSWNAITERVKEYYIFLLVLQTGMLGAFMALDFMLFFLFWEVMLVPMYFLIGIWGSANRLYSAIKFFLYTLVGSVDDAARHPRALLRYNHPATGVYTFDITQFHKFAFAPEPAVVGVPGVLPRLRGQGADVPVPHLAARRAHRRADRRLGDPGGRHAEDGHLRVPALQPADSAGGDAHFVPMMVLLSIIGIVYGALVALAQKDWKRLVAYSSVSHMAMVMLGMFALNPVGLTGSIIQQLNHGISTGGLFLLVGVVYERRHTREISEYGGLSKVMPVYAAIFLVMTMSSIGLPTLNGFIGELLILQGVFVANKVWAAFAASGVVLGAAYMLYLYQRTMFGKIENPKNERLLDLSHREFATFAPLLVLAVWMGIYPAPFLRRLETSVQHIIAARQPAVRRASTPSATRRRRRRRCVAASTQPGGEVPRRRCRATSNGNPLPSDHAPGAGLGADAARRLALATSTTSCRSSCSPAARCSC